MNHKVLRAMEQYSMVRPGDLVVVGVSGGADSVALLHFLWENRKAMQIRLTACHVNHNLRGEESDRDELFVRRLCAGWDIELAVFSAQVAREAEKTGESIEAYGRRSRYRFFEEAAGETGRIATAHTGSDTAETMLFHMARGTGLKGLCGIPPVRGRIIRPLILCSREEIEAYCREHNLTYVTDSSNFSDEYSRNRIRHQIMPCLQELNPNAAGSMAELALLLRKDADYLDKLAQRALNRLTPDGVHYNRRRLLRLDEALSCRILQKIGEMHAVSLERKHLSVLDRMIREGSGTLQLGDNCYFTASNSCLSVTGACKPQPYFEASVPAEKLVEPVILQVYPGKKVCLRQKHLVHLQNNCKYSVKHLKNLLDYDKISGILTVRQRKPGDKVSLAGRGVTKTLKKLFNESGIEPQKRGKIAVIEDQSGILWVEGFGPSEHCAVHTATKRFLHIEVMGEQDAGDDQ